MPQKKTPAAPGDRQVATPEPVIMFGQLVDRAGAPVVGARLRLEDGAKKAATQWTATTATGLFVLTIPEHDAGELAASAHVVVEGADERIAVHDLPTKPGLYGPATLVLRGTAVMRTGAVPPGLLLDGDRLVAAVAAAPELFVRAAAIGGGSPCAPGAAGTFSERSFQYTSVSMLALPQDRLGTPGNVSKALALHIGPEKNTNSELGGSSDPSPAPELYVDDTPKELNGYRFGTIVTFQQDWRELGYTLGDLVYSVALAPAEEVKIATLDWRRYDTATTQSSLTEQTSQDSVLAKSDHVDQAVQQAQQSNKTSNTDTQTVGAGFSFSIDGFGGGLSYSDTNQHQTVDQTMQATQQASQQINDNVHQASNALRTTQAMSVAEVQESEAATVATRVIRNYNHSHTVTYQYYQVLQHYLVSTRPLDVRAVIFVPVVALNFDDKTIARHSSALRSLLVDPSLAPDLASAGGSTYYVPLPSSLPPLTKAGAFQIEFSTSRRLSAAERLQVSVAVTSEGKSFVFSTDTDIDLPKQESGGRITLWLSPQQPIDQIHDYTITDVTFTNPWSSTVEFETFNLWMVTADSQGAVDVMNPVMEGPVTLQPGQSFTAADGPVPTSPDGSPAGGTTYSDRLKAHLADWAYHYTTGILDAMDPQRRYLLLAGSSYDGVHGLNEIVEPTIVGAVGNYVALPLLSLDYLPPQYQGEGDGSVPDVSATRVITLPTPGIFAESELGQCSASEVIDDTRFWDWQRSPIPDSAPDITSDMLASRYEDLSNLLQVARSNLTADPAPMPADGALQFGDEFLSGLVKNVDFGNDPQQVLTFIQALLQALSGATPTSESGAGSGGSDVLTPTTSLSFGPALATA